QQFFDEVRRLCEQRGVPARVLKAGEDSPYSLWRKGHRWMQRRKLDPLRVERCYHAVGNIAIKYELDAAQSVRLFEDVRPALERLKAAEISVIIVSNNATEAVMRILENNDVEGLVDHVVGRNHQHELVGNLKPKPHLVRMGLARSGYGAHRALLVADSGDDRTA